MPAQIKYEKIEWRYFFKKHLILAINEWDIAIYVKINKMLYM